MSYSSTVTVIEKNSEAGRALALAFADPRTYKVSLSEDGERGAVKVKVNEGMWTAPLSTEETD